MDKLFCKISILKLQFMVAITILVSMFTSLAYSCPETVTLYIGKTDTEAQAQTYESRNVAEGDSVWFYAVVDSFTNSNLYRIQFQFDYDGNGSWDGTPEYLYSNTPTSSSDTAYLKKLSAEATCDFAGAKNPKVRVILVDGSDVETATAATDTCTLNVSGVDITDYPEKILAYINGYTSPTESATASGYPSGGTYSWTENTSETKMEFTSGETNDTVSFKGLWYGDVELTCEYTYGGIIASTSETVTVCRISTNTAYRGDYSASDSYHFTNYYHSFSDQDGSRVDKVGVPCQEFITWISGEPVGTTSDGTTANYSGEGSWASGVGVMDVLGCPAITPDTRHDQFLKAGGWGTSPEYYLDLEPSGISSPSLTKTAH